MSWSKLNGGTCQYTARITTALYYYYQVSWSHQGTGELVSALLSTGLPQLLLDWIARSAHIGDCTDANEISLAIICRLSGGFYPCLYRRKRSCRNLPYQSQLGRYISAGDVVARIGFYRFVRGLLPCRAVSHNKRVGLIRFSSRWVHIEAGT